MVALRNSLFVLSWIFVFLAGAYDAGYAWRFQDDFERWEMNPIAVWTAEEFGLSALLSIKLAGLAFAAGLAWYCRIHQLGLCRAITIAATCAYSVLSLYYVLSHEHANSQFLAACLR
ncbi:MAG: hypothetical protein HY040_14770 [Planctomycetes bacterium]|nr:hypothetical protein [Planctomycetota bacterium]